MKAHRISCICAECGISYQKRADRVLPVDYCTLTCRKVSAAAHREKRAQRCLHCGISFIPRSTQLRDGQGRYCSHYCGTSATMAYRNSPEARRKAIQTYRSNGHDKNRLRGPANPLWTGGKQAVYRRQIDSGKAKRRLAAYRSKNRERVREWGQKRKSGLTLRRLPWGTIPNLLTAQRSKCIYCRTNIKTEYHVDHIMPIAKGGKHEPKNLQLLCPKCNLNKSAKHPVDFAQSRGLLL